MNRQPGDNPEKDPSKDFRLKLKQDLSKKDESGESTKPSLKDINQSFSRSALPTPTATAEKRLSLQEKQVISSGSFKLKPRPDSQVGVGGDPSDDPDSSSSSSDGEKKGEEEHNPEEAEDQPEESEVQEVATKPAKKGQPIGNYKKPNPNQGRKFAVREEESHQVSVEDLQTVGDSTYQPGADLISEDTELLKKANPTKRMKAPARKQASQTDQSFEDYKEIDVLGTTIRQTTSISGHTATISTKISLLDNSNQTALEAYKTKEKIINEVKEGLDPLLAENPEAKKNFDSLISNFNEVLGTFVDDAQASRLTFEEIQVRLRSIDDSAKVIEDQIVNYASENEKLKKDLIEKMEDAARACKLVVFVGAKTAFSRIKLYKNFNQFMLFCTSWAKLYCGTSRRELIFCIPCHMLLFGGTNKGRFETPEFKEKMFLMKAVLKAYTAEYVDSAMEKFIELYSANQPEADEKTKKAKFEQLYMPFVNLPGTTTGKALYHKCIDSLTADQGQVSSNVKSATSSHKKLLPSSKKASPAHIQDDRIHGMITRSKATPASNQEEQDHSPVPVATRSIVKKSASGVSSAASKRRQSPQQTNTPAKQSTNQLIEEGQETQIPVRWYSDRIVLNISQESDIVGIQLNKPNDKMVAQYEKEDIGSIVFHFPPGKAPRPK